MWGLKSLRGALNNVASAVKEGVSVVNMDDLSDVEDEADDNRSSPPVEHDKPTSGARKENSSKPKARAHSGPSVDDLIEERNALEQKVTWMRDELSSQTEKAEQWRQRYEDLVKAAKSAEDSEVASGDTAANAEGTELLLAQHSIEDLRQQLLSAEAKTNEATVREESALARLKEQELRHAERDASRQRELDIAVEKAEMLAGQVAGLKQAVKDADAAAARGGNNNSLEPVRSEQDSTTIRELTEENQLLKEQMQAIKNTMRDLALKDQESDSLKKLVQVR